MRRGLARKVSSPAPAGAGNCVTTETRIIIRENMCQDMVTCIAGSNFVSQARSGCIQSPPPLPIVKNFGWKVNRMDNPLDERSESSSSVRTISLTKTFLSPAGKPLTVVVMGEESEATFALEILDNTEEYLQWQKAEILGTSVNGWEH